MYYLPALSLLTLLPVLAQAELPPPHLLSAAHGPYFVCDERVVEDRWGLERFLEAPRRHPRNPLIVREHPWEGTGPHMGGTVLRDPADNQFKMWYSVWNKEAYYGKQPFSYNVCYADSPDGIHWVKPTLGVFEYEGSTHNNVIKLGEDKTQNIDVCLNPVPEQYPGKYLAIHNQRGGVFVSFSEDGKTFTRLFNRPAIAYHSDTHNNFLYDPPRQRWLLYCRPRAYAGDHKRRVSFQEGPNLDQWTHERTILVPGETDLPEFYGMTVFRRGDLFFGTLQVYDRGAGLLRAELAWSGDGVHWSRIPTHPLFADVGPRGAWDAGMVLLAERPVEVGDELWFYYGGFPLPHDTKEENITGIGLLVSEKDRLVGVRPSAGAPGFLMTRPFAPEGRALRLNTRVQGQLRGELRTDNNVPIAGYTFDDCEPITTSGLNMPVQWHGRDLPEGSELLRIVFELRDAELFTFDLHAQ